jgi:hypothetical protein
MRRMPWAPSFKRTLFIFSAVCVCVVIWAVQSPTSYFHRTAYSLEKEAFHDHWLVEGLLFAHGLEAASPRWNVSSSHPSLCISMTTRDREVPYLYSALASLLKDASLDQLELHLVNTHRGGDAPHPLLPLFADKAFFRVHSYPWTDHPSLRLSENRYRMAVDYHTALSLCANSSAPWTLLLEDDVVIKQAFLPQWQKLVAHLSLEDTLFVKLFVSDRWGGFEDVDTVGGVCLLTLLLLGVCRCLWRFTGLQWLALTLGAYVCMLCLVLLVGKQNIRALGTPSHLHLARLTGKEVPGTVAIAFPTRQLGDLMAFLSKETERPNIEAIDVLVADTFVQNDQKRRTPYCSVPSMTQHIGAYSTRSKYFGRQSRFQYMGQDTRFRYNL